MKLKRVVSIPLALAADILTCGNIGGYRSFTQQVFDAEKQERENQYAAEILELLLKSKDSK